MYWGFYFETRVCLGATHERDVRDVRERNYGMEAREMRWRWKRKAFSGRWRENLRKWCLVAVIFLSVEFLCAGTVKKLCFCNQETDVSWTAGPLIHCIYTTIWLQTTATGLLSKYGLANSLERDRDQDRDQDREREDAEFTLYVSYQWCYWGW